MSQKIGFWAVFAIVTGSQIGSGVFMSPATLAPYGALGLLGWVVSGLGAMSLAYVFAKLCARFPKTGGPHVYVREAFGEHAAFFTGWTYWVVSFISSTAVVVTSISNLSPFLPSSPPLFLALELALLAFIVWLNLKGVKAAGNAEFILTVLKFIPLIVLPAIGLYFFDSQNLQVDVKSANFTLIETIGATTLLTLWGFIGLESATAPAGSVENPTKTIPRAILLGTFSVALIYIFSTVGVMGLVQGSVLGTSKAPYVDATQVLFGGHWHYAISIIVSIVCIGTLNAWVLTSGQISLGLAQDGYLPKRFAKTNENGAPALGILASGLGIVPFIIFTNSETFGEQIAAIVEISVISFLFVYVLCCLSNLWICFKERNLSASFLEISTSILALIFCIFIISQTPLVTLGIASVFTLSGIPVFLLRKKKAG